MRVELVLFVKVPTEHLRRLIHGVFDLDSDTTAGLRLLDDLVRLVVDLKRRAEGER